MSHTSSTSQPSCRPCQVGLGPPSPTILVHCGTPQHTPYPAKGPVLPRGSGRSPRRKFWPLNVIYTQKTRAPMTYCTSFESSHRDLRENLGIETIVISGRFQPVSDTTLAYHIPYQSQNNQKKSKYQYDTCKCRRLRGRDSRKSCVVTAAPRAGLSY